MADDTYKNYVEELGSVMKEYALEAVSRRDKASNAEEKNYLNGYVMGYHRILTLMIQQAESMLIPLKDIGLTDLDPDKDLI